MELSVSCEGAVSVGCLATASEMTVVLSVVVSVVIPPVGTASVVVAGVPPSRTVAIDVASIAPG